MGDCDRYIRYKGVLIEEDCLESAKLEGRAEGIVEGIAQGRAEGRAKGRAEGKAEGLAQGRAEAQIEMARKLKAMGVPSDIIMKTTVLSSSEIDQLQFRDNRL